MFDHEIVDLVRADLEAGWAKMSAVAQTTHPEDAEFLMGVAKAIDRAHLQNRFLDRRIRRLMALGSSIPDSMEASPDTVIKLHSSVGARYAREFLGSPENAHIAEAAGYNRDGEYPPGFPFVFMAIKAMKQMPAEDLRRFLDGFAERRDAIEAEETTKGLQSVVNICEAFVKRLKVGVDANSLDEVSEAITETAAEQMIATLARVDAIAASHGLSPEDLAGPGVRFVPGR